MQQDQRETPRMKANDLLVDQAGGENDQTIGIVLADRHHAGELVTLQFRRGKNEQVITGFAHAKIDAVQQGSKK